MEVYVLPFTLLEWGGLEMPLKWWCQPRHAGFPQTCHTSDAARQICCRSCCVVYGSLGMRTSRGRGDNDLLAIAWARRGMWPAQAIDRAERYKFDCVVNMDFAPRTIGTHPCRCDPEAKSKLLQESPNSPTGPKPYPLHLQSYLLRGMTGPTEPSERLKP